MYLSCRTCCTCRDHPCHSPLACRCSFHTSLSLLLPAALWPTAELAPLLHLANELFLAPFLLAGFGALATQEACGFIDLVHRKGILNLTLGYINNKVEGCQIVDLTDRQGKLSLSRLGSLPNGQALPACPADLFTYRDATREWPWTLL